MAAMDLAKRLIVKPGTRVRLAEWDPRQTPGIADKKEAQPILERNTRRLTDLQYRLYAEDKRALLIVLQAMDAGGKDGTIRHVMGPLNPQSCRVTSFKPPSAEELAHDFLWRVHKAVPRRGEIGIFNRSHYEDVLIVRVRGLVPRAVWFRRYDQINAFEAVLAANGVHVVKFYLHISKKEQLERLRERLRDPHKRWKTGPDDFRERRRWNDYQAAYEDALSRCSTAEAPWYVIPADRKWYRNLAVSQIVVETLEGFRMKFPKPRFDLKKLKAK
jgi:PPK2 family polyphosphate:nucleotide phosphotransferase